MRKTMFIKYSQAFVVLPGGFGTMDELFEAVTLVATGKITRFPIVLVGSGHAIFGRIRNTAQELRRTYGPPLMETLQRYQQGNLVLARAAVPPAKERVLAERVARVLAFAPEPILAEDIARALEMPGNLRDRTRSVRAELRSCAAFVEVRRGRWMLGVSNGADRQG